MRGGKIAALVGLILLLAAIAALVSVATFLVLPAISVSAAQWLQLAGFLFVSALYMAIFGLIGLGAGAMARSEAAGLLIPVTIWLTLTFIFPQLTANLNPTAAINPIAAVAPPPDTAFFHWTARILGPVSLADSYKFASARLLDFLPQGITAPSFIPPVADLMLAALLCGAITWRALTGMSTAQGDYNV